MARSATYRDTLVARIRRYFGLGQHELAALLGISPAQAHYLEAGRRSLTPEVSARLLPFAQQLPPEGAPPEPLPTAPVPGPFDAAPLHARRAACLHEAANLRWRVRALPAQVRHASRWARALPALRAALAPPPPEGEAPPTREAVRLRLAHAWLELCQLALPPATLAQWHLAHQRALALEAEAAALGALLAAQAGA